MIHEAMRQGVLTCIEVAVNLLVTHLLFVDDILLFSNGSLEDCRCLKDLLDLFLKATSLCINGQKSSMTTSGLSRDEVGRIEADLQFEVKPLQDTFKYLGFFLKLDSSNPGLEMDYCKDRGSNETL